MNITNDLRSKLLEHQRVEITEHHIYQRLAKVVSSPENKKVLRNIAEDELRHYQNWKTYTGTDIEPRWMQVWIYYLISRLFGFTFGVKLMELGENNAHKNYSKLSSVVPDAQRFAQEEDEHEKKLLGMLDEDILRYVSSIVLGLNDALVELTGALAGLTFALQNRQLVALTGLITGIAAALSMAASEYLSTKTEETLKNPFRAAVYTGSAYVITVLVLITPFLVLSNIYLCLGLSLILALVIIAFFNFYISVAKDLPFRRRFVEMAGLSLGVAAFTFLIGILIRTFLGVEV
jgi:VIT1/CCC1 family predicted Fe2+/Mn2+ transporter